MSGLRRGSKMRVTNSSQLSYGNGIWNLNDDTRAELAKSLELMSIPRPRIGGNRKPQEDWSIPLAFCDERHIEDVLGLGTISNCWRMKERMKTVSVALVMCLRIGIDPPDVIKTHPCARLECWIDPQSMSAEKALPAIGSALQKQYERWQPRARYKCSLDPTSDEIKKLCTTLRRNAKDERVLFHYNGHGVPKPTENGEIWVFDRGYTQYIPLSIAELQKWMSAPSLFVYDCSNAGMVVKKFKDYAEGLEREYDLLRLQQNHFAQSLPPQNAIRNCIQLAACSADQILPMNAELPADLFTSCLTTPIRMALRWYVLQNRSRLVPAITVDMVDKVPGILNDRRTMLGELNWILTAITDTIAWNTLPRDLFQKLFRQDLLVASLFRNFLLAERIMRSYDCVPVSSPALPATYQHPMWQAWDYSLDMSLSQLPKMLESVAGTVASDSVSAAAATTTLLTQQQHKPVPFFAQQLTAFHVWLKMGFETRSPPEQLPIVLQVLLSQVHRLRALELLTSFLDIGPWAVNLALSVGIFPYVLKLLQSNARELRPLLVYIWAKILAVDDTCQSDLLRDGGHKYFLAIMSDPHMSADERCAAVFVIARLVRKYPEAQEAALKENTITLCLSQINEPDATLRLWITLCLGHLWMNHSASRWCGVRNNAHEKLIDLLTDSSPEVRAAAVFSLGTFIGSIKPKDRSEHANTVDHSVAISLLNAVSRDGSPLVRKELLVALQWMVAAFESAFVAVAAAMIEEEEGSASLAYNSPILPSNAGGGTLRRIATRVSMGSRHGGGLVPVENKAGRFHVTMPMGVGDNMRRVSSSSSIASQALGSLTSAVSIPSASTHVRLYRGFEALSRDPSPGVAEMAKTLLKILRAKRYSNSTFVTLVSAVQNSCGWNLAPPALYLHKPLVEATVPLVSASRGHHHYYRPGSSDSEHEEQVKYNTIHAGVSPSTSGTLARPLRTSMPSGTSSSLVSRLSAISSSAISSGKTRRLSPTLQQALSPIKTEMEDLLLRRMPSSATADPTNKGPLNLSTEFVEWCARTYSAGKASRHRATSWCASASHAVAMGDLESDAYYRRELRFRKNARVRSDAAVERGRVMDGQTRLEEQVMAARNLWAPTVMRLHPYEPVLLVADEEHLSTWDLVSGTRLGYLENQNPPKLGITAVEVVNAQEGVGSLVMIGSRDGAVRVWANLTDADATDAGGGGLSSPNEIDGRPSLMAYSGSKGTIRVSAESSLSGHQFQPKLVTAWQIFSELLQSTRNAGVLLNWNQRCEQVAASGDVRVIRLWDTRRELRIADLPTGADCCVTCLSRSQDGNMIAAGCGDGTVRLFDVRLSPSDARVKVWREHPSWVLAAMLHEGDGSGLRVVSGWFVLSSVPGEVRIWDLRQHESMACFQGGELMSAMAVHPQSIRSSGWIIAFKSSTAGSTNHQISIHKGLVGECVGTYKYYEGFMGQRIGPVSCLSFHDFNVRLASGSSDTTLGVYGPKSLGASGTSAPSATVSSSNCASSSASSTSSYSSTCAPSYQTPL
ncbi:unnamed protein product [Notodromas monacha]|uniref:Raptor N-terminal CASPase-like domain-containing protein n=1 Tax=Notodromas monacha TaxID=399045 RepID=A0A7R9BCV7_9CRUS|nr:unnamed protein product [Notodromas monacha]CAG0912964.1 unnamed protein product [Notodromas monacha]